MFKWFPSRTRRVFVQCGMAISLLIILTRIISFPWSWRYIDDVYLEILFFAVFIPSVILLFRDFRRVYPPSRCPKCGYNLTGNVSGICPECGERI